MNEFELSGFYLQHFINSNCHCQATITKRREFFKVFVVVMCVCMNVYVRVGVGLWLRGQVTGLE